MNKIIILLVALLLIISGCKDEINKNKRSRYYVDSRNGNDRHSGASPEKAWKSLKRIRKQKFSAGDRIYLLGNNNYPGSLRLDNIEGTKDFPVVIASYGRGQANIESGDSLALLASNCKYLRISNIKASGSGRLKGNTANGIELLNCKFCEIDSTAAHGFLYSGIRITGGSDIRITNSKAYENGFCGINVESGESSYGVDGSAYKTMKRLYIRRCVAFNNPGCPIINDNHSGNGILVGGVSGGIIEYCEAMNNGWDMPREGNGPVGIWAYMSDSIIIQNCYSHHNNTSPN